MLQIPERLSGISLFGPYRYDPEGLCRVYAHEILTSGRRMSSQQREDAQAMCPAGLIPEGVDERDAAKRVMAALAVACGYPIDFVLRAAFRRLDPARRNYVAGIVDGRWEIVTIPTPESRSAINWHQAPWQLPDPDLAAQLRLPVPVIRAVRRLLPPVPLDVVVPQPPLRAPGTTWEKWEDELLQTGISEVEASRRLGRSIAAIRSRKSRVKRADLDRRPEILAQLGRMRDIDLARKYYYPTRDVRAARLARGIPMYGQMRDPAPTYSLWVDAEIALLGTAPDSDIAARLGRSQVSVREARRSRGIPPFCAQVRAAAADEEKSYGT